MTFSRLRGLSISFTPNTNGSGHPIKIFSLHFDLILPVSGIYTLLSSDSVSWFVQSAFGSYSDSTSYTEKLLGGFLAGDDYTIGFNTKI